MKIKLSILILAAIAAIGCRPIPSTEKYLEQVLANLEAIRSATYISHRGDTLTQFVREYDNPKDTHIGAAFVRLNPDDRSLESGYDGTIKALVDRQQQYDPRQLHHAALSDASPRRPTLFQLCRKHRPLCAYYDGSY